MAEDTTPSRPAVRVWDVPVRLVHWATVIAVALSWWTGETGRLEWHRWSGYALLGLVTFRIYWGFFGSSTARFRQFVRGPRAVAGYLRGAWNVAAGHNPLGALSVLALIVLLLAQVMLGLFAVDVDGIESGPLSLYVSFETGRLAAEWHEAVFNVLLALTALHIVAIAWYRVVKKEKLVEAMIHGTRAYPQDVPPVQHASLLRLVLGIVLASGFTWAVARAFEF
ncbi:MAG TPA: cytochrome b/b6 domain-containing protein [Steroidobacteraceae bacterium]|jgi:cytochrome b|nr:cytochrome b/b6 domain-containing protein [Steroidobacteraceae bacterium]